MVPFLGHEGNTVIVLARLITVGALQEMGLGSTRERESKLFGMSFFPKGRQEFCRIFIKKKKELEKQLHTN